jgi:hypothetical protein
MRRRERLVARGQDAGSSSVVRRLDGARTLCAFARAGVVTFHSPPTSVRSLLCAIARWPPACPQPRWPPLKALALVAGRPLATLGTTAGRPRASRRSPPSRRCVRATVRAWADRAGPAGAAADGDGAGPAPDTRGGGECRQPCVAARSDARRVAERPQDAVVANVRAPSRCKNMRCFFLSFLTATHEYLVAT